MQNVYASVWCKLDDELKKLREQVQALHVACEIVADSTAVQLHGATAALYGEQQRVRRELSAKLRQWYMVTLLRDSDTDQILVRDLPNAEEYVLNKLINLAEVTGPNVIVDVLQKAKTINEECIKKIDASRSGNNAAYKVLWFHALDALVEAEVRFAPMWSQIEHGVAVVQAKLANSTVDEEDDAPHPSEN